MNAVAVFGIVAAALFVIWAALVWLFGGEKYKKWYYRYLHADKYDTRKFKLVHVLFLLFAAACFLLIGFGNPEYSWIVLLVFIASSFLQYLLLYTVCKKKQKTE